MNVLKSFAGVSCKHLVLFRIIHRDGVVMCSHLNENSQGTLCYGSPYFCAFVATAEIGKVSDFVY